MSDPDPYPGTLKIKLALRAGLNLAWTYYLDAMGLEVPAIGRLNHALDPVADAVAVALAASGAEYPGGEAFVADVEASFPGAYTQYLLRPMGLAGAAAREAVAVGQAMNAALQPIGDGAPFPGLTALESALVLVVLGALTKWLQQYGGPTLVTRVCTESLANVVTAAVHNELVAA